VPKWPIASLKAQGTNEFQLTGGVDDDVTVSNEWLLWSQLWLNSHIVCPPTWLWIVQVTQSTF